MKLSELAERLGCRLEGDGDVDIVRVAGLEQAAPGDVTFVSNPKYRSRLSATRASAAILGPPSGDDPPAPCAVLRSDQPYVAFAHAVRMFARGAPPTRGIDRLSAIAPDAIIGSDASIGPFVTIGAGASVGARATIYPSVVIGAGARIGDDCVLHAGVSIREGVIIGHRVTVLDGAVIGSDGFGFAKQSDGTHVKIPQHADVVIEDDVEIGANTAIDRPAVGETRIHAGTKIDNLVQIAHGVSIGRRALLAAQVGIAGSTVVEDDVMLGGQVGVTGHVRIGKGAMASAKTGITGNVEAGVLVSGYPSLPNREWRKTQVLVRHLPDLKKRVAELEQRIAELEEKLAECRTPDR
ncbi:MAG: UDP-3-O-(3-hydroxymyristoyl)glucosamine N-acyltransferase [Acidobacteria bacterium 13_1_40CM_65_14]|jgi:UDP-3-O-[3-hydroxymyristoyl] glucosamine N-acyltransferase|nr:MAG: UDP-3-O-(3-hydroxymyristoyl)glucosamine N-acyltransferase [Acidobacteria bacterium 13_1_40CM_65_14]